MNYLQYKGYFGTIEPDIDGDYLFGKLAFVRDLVTYEAKTPAALKKEFEFAVDAYLEDCKALGKEPDKPFKGSFNVRIGSELHKKAVIAANQQGLNLNEFIKQAVEQATHYEQVH